MNENKIVLDYLNAFSEKRMETLDALFADDIELIDWDNHLQGKQAVLEFNYNLFQAVKRIDIYIDQLGDGADTIFAQIKVVVDGTAIDVVDVITISNGKIKRIHAYKS